MPALLQSETEEQFDELFDLFHHHFYYDRRTRDLYWRVPTTPRVKAGAPAGHLNKSGVVVVGFYGESYKLHRIAYFMVKGDWPMLGRDTKDKLIGSLTGVLPNRRIA